MNSLLPGKLLIDSTTRDYPGISQVINKARELEIKVELINNHSPYNTANLTPGTVFLETKKRSYLKNWSHPAALPDSPEICLTPIQGCLFNCRYCYLQDYLENSRFVAATINYQLLTAELETAIARGGNNFSLGELSDGLLLEPLINYLPELWPSFYNNPGASLEIRTKTDTVESVINNIKPLNNLIFSWTLTPAETAPAIELGAPPVAGRIEALKQLQSKGFRTAIRFDPIILTTDWAENYYTFINRLKNTIQFDRLSFVKLGTFRFPRGLDKEIIRRFPGTDFIRDEFILSPDGKYRYPRGRRTGAYNYLIDLLKDSTRRIELSMEPDYIWKAVGL